MLNDAIYLIEAECRARALCRSLLAQSGDNWRITSVPDADGTALLALARWGERFGITVCVARPQFESGAGTVPQAWRRLVKSAEQLDLVQDSREVRTRNRLLFSRGAKTAPEEFALHTIPDGRVAWLDRLDDAPPFVRRAGTRDSLLTAEESRAVDARASRDYGVPSLCLMENAAVGAASVARDMLHPQAGRAPRVVVLAGGGNNGGDGLALARGLCCTGIRAEVVLLKHPDGLTGDAGVNLALYRDTPGAILYPLHESVASLPRILANSDLAVDALLGTGFKGSPSPLFAEAIAKLNASNLPVLSLDLPSGINADSGLAPEMAVRAKRTVTFVAPKIGLVKQAGAECAGEVYIADIGAPRQALPRGIH